FKLAWDIVSRDCLLFERNTIRPDQCDRLYASLHLLGDPAQEISRLFDSVRSLPLSVIPCRYDLLMALHCVNNVINEISVLLVSFRRACNTSSRSAMLQLQEIQQKLFQLEQSNESIQQSIDRMLFLIHADEDGIQAVVCSLN